MIKYLFYAVKDKFKNHRMWFSVFIFEVWKLAKLAVHQILDQSIFPCCILPALDPLVFWGSPQANFQLTEAGNGRVPVPPRTRIIHSHLQYNYSKGNLEHPVHLNASFWTVEDWTVKPDNLEKTHPHMRNQMQKEKTHRCNKGSFFQFTTVTGKVISHFTNCCITD